MAARKKVIASIVLVILVISIGAAALYIISQPPPQPTALFTYNGESIVPYFYNAANSQYVYSWGLTITNMIPMNRSGFPGETLRQPFVSKYPQLDTLNAWIPEEGGTGWHPILFSNVTASDGNLARQRLEIYARLDMRLNYDQIGNLTRDLNTYLAPAVIEWYS